MMCPDWLGYTLWILIFIINFRNRNAVQTSMIIHFYQEIAILEFPTSVCFQNEAICENIMTAVAAPLQMHCDVQKDATSFWSSRRARIYLRIIIVPLFKQPGNINCSNCLRVLFHGQHWYFRWLQTLPYRVVCWRHRRVPIQPLPLSTNISLEIGTDTCCVFVVKWNNIIRHYNTPMWHFGPCVTFRPCQCHLGHAKMHFRPWGCSLPVAPSPANYKI